jgi:hypothetical protein
MTTDMPETDEPVELSNEQVAYHRQVLAAHANQPGTGTCPVCGVARCPDWMRAYDILAAARQLMSTEPPPWEPFRRRVKPGDVQPPNEQGRA